MSAYAIMKEGYYTGLRQSFVKPHAVFFGSARELKALLKTLNTRARKNVYYGVRVRRITQYGNML